MNVNRKIIHIDEELCDGCGQCAPACMEGAIEIRDGKARLIGELYCDGLGACLGECPTGALTIIERDAEEFDEEAVEELLRARSKEEPSKTTVLPCGCPSTQLQTFAPISPCSAANEPVRQQSVHSALMHWPVKIRLVPPTAPFLKGADLLVAADCTAVACANFHRDFLKRKVVMVGCPKFDNAQEYIDKFADIFSTATIRSITVLVMEVPCCQGLPSIVEKGMEKAGKTIPLEKIIIGPSGEIKGMVKNAA